MLSYHNNLDYFQELEQSSLRDELSLRAILRERDPGNHELRQLHRKQRSRYHTRKNIEANNQEFNRERIQRELNEIRAELGFYSSNPDSDTEGHYDLYVQGFRTPSPRARYLVTKRRHLQSLLSSLRRLKPAPQKNEEPSTLAKIKAFFQKIAQNKIVKRLIAVFEVGKKIIDIIDDAWTAVGNAALP